MMRVVDLEGYSASIRIPEHATESVILHLSDEMCPWNQGTYRLTPNSGFLEAERLGDSAEPDVSINALGLSEIIGGLNPATILRGLGRIDCTAKVAENLESIFPADSFVSYQRF